MTKLQKAINSRKREQGIVVKDKESLFKIKRKAIYEGLIEYGFCIGYDSFEVFTDFDFETTQDDYVSITVKKDQVVIKHTAVIESKKDRASYAIKGETVDNVIGATIGIFEKILNNITFKQEQV